jgi:hypothetical protein
MSAQLQAVVRNQKLKTDAVGAAGVLVGVGVGEYVGNLVANMATPTSTPSNKGAVSAVTKFILGIAVLFLNTMGGLSGIFVMGLAWGIIGSVATDIVVMATGKSISFNARATALQLTTMQARSTIQQVDVTNPRLVVAEEQSGAGLRSV